MFQPHELIYDKLYCLPSMSIYSKGVLTCGFLIKMSTLFLSLGFTPSDVFIIYIIDPGNDMSDNASQVF